VTDGTEVDGVIPLLHEKQIPLKAKAVPLHATKALEWRGCIAPTHSRHRH